MHKNARVVQNHLFAAQIRRNEYEVQAFVLIVQFYYVQALGCVRAICCRFRSECYAKPQSRTLDSKKMVAFIFTCLIKFPRDFQSLILIKKIIWQ